MAHNIHVQYDGGVDSLQNGVKAIKMVDENGEEQWYYPEGEEPWGKEIRDYLEGNKVQYKLSNIYRISDYAFCGYHSLKSVYFPDCLYIGKNAFSNCYMLSSISFPACASIGELAFENCTRLLSVNFPACEYIGHGAFSECQSLSLASFLRCSIIGSSAFCWCSNLTSFYLLNASVCRLEDSYVFEATPMRYNVASQYGSIYVPSYLVAAYKNASNWSYYADRICAFT